MRRIDWTILRRSLRDELGEEDEKILSSWLDEAEEHREFYRKMRDFFSGGEKEGVDVERNFHRFERRTFHKRRLAARRLWSRVAVLAVACGAGLALLRLQNERREAGTPLAPLSPGKAMAVLHTDEGRHVALGGERRLILLSDSTGIRQDNDTLNYAGVKADGRTRARTHTLEVPRGGEFCTLLSDSTTVYLNSESKLTYPVTFDGGERRVRLEGEAYFDVARTGQPFVIEAGKMSIRVLGTRFNARAYADEGKIATTLEEGLVSVSAGDTSLLLEPGEQAVLDEKGALTKRRVDTYLFTAWREGVFVFKDERLEDVLNTVARWYNLHVFYQNGASRDTRINGNISRYSDFSVLLEKLEKLELVRFKIRGRTITVIDE